MKIVKHIIYTIFFIWGNYSYSQTKDSLQHYLKIAAENNPGVQTNFYSYKASLEKIPQAGAWQDPALDIGFYLEPMEVIGGKQVADFTVMQMFPWFGTKKAAQAESSHMANVNFEKFKESRNNLYLEVYTQWYLLCSLQQKLLNNKENKDLLVKLEDLSLRRFSASSEMSDVLRIQLETAEVDNEIQSILSEIKAEKAKFNMLLNRDITSELTIPDSFEQSEIIFDEDDIISKIKEHNPAQT